VYWDGKEETTELELGGLADFLSDYNIEQKNVRCSDTPRSGSSRTVQLQRSVKYSLLVH
jgi:hypothetical protein